MKWYIVVSYTFGCNNYDSKAVVITIGPKEIKLYDNKFSSVEEVLTEEKVLQLSYKSLPASFFFFFLIEILSFVC